MGELLKQPAKDLKIVCVAGTWMVQHIPTILLEILVDTYVDVCVWRMKDSRYIVEQTNILCTGCHVKLDNVWSGLRLCIHYFIAMDPCVFCTVDSKSCFNCTQTILSDPYWNNIWLGVDLLISFCSCWPGVWHWHSHYLKLMMETLYERPMC